MDFDLTSTVVALVLSLQLRCQPPMKKALNSYPKHNQEKTESIDPNRTHFLAHGLGFGHQVSDSVHQKMHQNMGKRDRDTRGSGRNYIHLQSLHKESQRPIDEISHATKQNACVKKQNINLPVVPHEAVAEVSKIGNL